MQQTPLRVAFKRPWPGTRRGLKLWLIAVIVGIKGTGYLFGETSSSTDSALRLVTSEIGIPLTWCGAAIVAICLFAAFCSYCHFGRDRFGYVALVAFCVAWAAAFATAPIFFDGPWYALQGTASYSIFAAFLLVSAADVEVPGDRGDR